MSLKMAKFSLQKFDVFNMVSDSLLVENWGTLEPARRHVCKNLLNLGCGIVFVLAFFKLLKNEESFGKSFSFPFSEKCFHRNVKHLF